VSAFSATVSIRQSLSSSVDDNAQICRGGTTCEPVARRKTFGAVESQALAPTSSRARLLLSVEVDPDRIHSRWAAISAQDWTQTDVQVQRACGRLLDLVHERQLARLGGVAPAHLLESSIESPTCRWTLTFASRPHEREQQDTPMPRK